MITAVVVYWVGGTIAAALIGMIMPQVRPVHRKLGARLVLTSWAWPAWLATWLALETRKLLEAAEWWPENGEES